MAQKTKKTQKMSAKQKAAKLAAAQEREAAAAAKKEKSARLKKIGVVAVCVVLILALGMPVMALTMCSSPSTSGAPAADVAAQSPTL